MSVISEKCKKRLFAGYTLLELAVVIFIAGLLMAMAAGFAMPLLEKSKRLETEAKMAKISKALNFYAVRNYRIPCPAVPNRGASNPPYGFERGSGANGDAFAADCGSQGRAGIPPFNTIGLTEDDVIDGWGNPITYIISQVFAQDPDRFIGGFTLQVHPSCRTRDWYYTDGHVAANANILQHKAPRKARFCCPGEHVYTANSDLSAQNVNGTSIMIPRSANESASSAAPTGSVCRNIFIAVPPCSGIECCSGYNTVDFPFSITANTAVPPTDRVTAIAYALISHGENGLGVYDLTAGNRPSATPNGFEAENRDDDLRFYDIDTEDAAGSGYDDIVLWRTQDMILAENGDSCAVP